MDISQIPLFAMLSRRMAWLGKRQEILAQNIANANTPDYRARDLSDSGFKALLRARQRPVALATTAPGHIAGPGAARLVGGGRGDMPIPDSDLVPHEDETVETKADGNAVDLESELVKVSETAARYQMVTTLYRKHVGMIRIALGRPGS